MVETVSDFKREQEIQERARNTRMSESFKKRFKKFMLLQDFD